MLAWRCVSVSAVPLMSLALAAALSLGAPARASDGVYEINQVCATQTGCFGFPIPFNDTPGFPVGIWVSGSYRLTSNLNVPNGAIGILLNTSDVTLDLGGFTIQGPTVCTGSGLGLACSPVTVGAHGVAAVLGTARFTLLNGTVRGMPGAGVEFLGSSMVFASGLTVTGNAGGGLRISDGRVTKCNVFLNQGDGVTVSAGLVDATRSEGNERFGGHFYDAPTVGLARNVFAGNGLVQLNGGTGLAGNRCEDDRCASDGRRRFYLSPVPVNGAAALSACHAGYHMASLWEIHDPSQLAYAANYGVTTGDTGKGPVAFSGWARTGFETRFLTQGAGFASCAAWTASDGVTTGSLVALDPSWGDASMLDQSPWQAQHDFCSAVHNVWCVED